MKVLLSDFQKGLKNFYHFIEDNILKVVAVITVYLISISAIGLVNFPYIDDTARQIDGSTNFGRHYGRWGSELLSWLVQGSHHLTNMGLVTHFLTAIFLGVASLVVIYLFNRKFSWLSVFASTILGLNPWFLQCVSFRYDSPYMALSILFSVLPFLWWTINKKSFYILSIVGIFLMCNTYQLSSGIFIVVALSLCLISLLSGGKFLETLKKLLLSAISYIIAMALFAIETKLNPEIIDRGATVALAKLSDLPTSILRNIKVYFQTVYSEMAHIVIVLAVLVILLFILLSVTHATINHTIAVLYTIFYLVLASVFSYGVLLIFQQPLSAWSLRYEYGLAVMFTIILTMLIDNTSIQSIGGLQIFSRILVILTIYYSLSFPFVYAANLSAQKDSFDRQSIILTTDLKNMVTEKTSTVYMSTLFRDSPVLINSERNYPILSKLVPSNQSLYWPNTTLFNTQSGLNINIQQLDVSTFKKRGKKLVLESKLYDIYSNKNDLFIIMK
ncbi:glucosyltransferase domain-containing protein [Lapidilactobacillus gannanensis]|uniref:Glucosyltransferase domain-containing protein n=1 Tax=Lapidilactobacillus gannanensis TaxID=2486002 RepID=A0ABW4BNX3_9LACO|nr:glucosyltransferase domain-containing protein [Lapidilactobacillus gannanensis]